MEKYKITPKERPNTYGSLQSVLGDAYFKDYLAITDMSRAICNLITDRNNLLSTRESIATIPDEYLRVNGIHAGQARELLMMGIEQKLDDVEKQIDGLNRAVCSKLPN